MGIGSENCESHSLRIFGEDPQKEKPRGECFKGNGDWMIGCLCHCGGGETKWEKNERC